MVTSPRRSASSRYPIGYFHIDIAELRTAKGKLIFLSPSTEPRSSPLQDCWTASTPKQRQLLQIGIETQFANLSESQVAESLQEGAFAVEAIGDDVAQVAEVMRETTPWT